MRKRPTLIMVRMTPTEAKATLAGVPSIASFKTFMTSIVAFNEERATSRRFGGWAFGFIVEARGSREKRAWRTGCARGPKLQWRDRQPVRRSVVMHPRAAHATSFGEKNYQRAIRRPYEHFAADFRMDCAAT